MQGIPGSGKSTAAKMLYPPAKIFSTDEFWGEDYDYDPARAGFAHRWNQERVRWAMLQGYRTIVVDNTNLTRDAMRPYEKLATLFGYRLSVYRIDTPLEVCLERNRQRPPHRMIPEEVIREMHAKLEAFNESV